MTKETATAETTTAETTTAPKGIALSAPVTVNGQPVTHVQVSKPNAGAMRGLKLTEVLQMDVNTMVKLLPRITTPGLPPEVVAELEPADLLGLSQEVLVFFSTPTQRLEMGLED